MLPLWCEPDSGLRVGLLTEPEEIEKLVRLFEDVADAQGWQPEGALRLWLARSVYFALEVNGKLAGGLQLALPDSQGGLPCQVVWPEVSIHNAGRCAHVCMMSLAESYRGENAHFWRLAAEMWRYCVEGSIATLFMVLIYLTQRRISPSAYPCSCGTTNSILT